MTWPKNKIFIALNIKNEQYIEKQYRRDDGRNNVPSNNIPIKLKDQPLKLSFTNISNSYVLVEKIMFKTTRAFICYLLIDLI